MIAFRPSLLALVLVVSLAYFGEIHAALHSTRQAAVSLLLLGGLLSGIVLSSLVAARWITSQPILDNMPVARLFVLPVAWSSAWGLIGLYSPLGRQVCLCACEK